MRGYQQQGIMTDSKKLQAIEHHVAILAYHDTKHPGFPAAARRFAELFEVLVPARGEAASVQGEALRSVARLASEDRRNGCMNWNASYERFVGFLRRVFADGRVFGDERQGRIGRDLDAVMKNGPRAGVEAEMMRVVFGRLIEDAVAYCEALPELVPMSEEPKQVR